MIVFYALRSKPLAGTTSRAGGGVWFLRSRAPPAPLRPLTSPDGAGAVLRVAQLPHRARRALHALLANHGRELLVLQRANGWVGGRSGGGLRAALKTRERGGWGVGRGGV